MDRGTEFGCPIEAAGRREETRSAAEKRLEAERQEHPGEPSRYPSKLRVTELYAEPKAFQPRDPYGNLAGSEGHIATLVEAIRRAPRHELEPLVVWWSGLRWIVVDGHHRLEAYRRFACDPMGRPRERVWVPVAPLRGAPLGAALARSLGDNSRDRLPLSQDDKMTGAWRMVCRGGMSKAETARCAGVAERSVATMRATRRRLLEKQPGSAAEELVNMGWEEARGRDAGVAARLPYEEWEEREAAEWARRLKQAFGEKAAGNSDVLARALAMYSPALPGALMDSPHWEEALEELLSMRERSKGAEEEEFGADF